VEIKIEPKLLKPVNKSILVRLNPINLIKPDFKINIMNESEESVFSKRMSFDQLSSFVWIPKKPGIYNLTLEINSQNKKNMKIEKKFKTVDLDKKLAEYHFLLQQKCQADGMN
jgi:hypothetical protein